MVLVGNLILMNGHKWDIIFLPLSPKVFVMVMLVENITKTRVLNGIFQFIVFLHCCTALLLNVLLTVCYHNNNNYDISNVHNVQENTLTGWTATVLFFLPKVFVECCLHKYLLKYYVKCTVLTLECSNKNTKYMSWRGITDLKVRSVYIVSVLAQYIPGFNSLFSNLVIIILVYDSPS